VTTFLVTCGETSGEHHASRLVRALKRLDQSCRVVALGGRELAAAGAEILYPMERYAVMGFAEVAARLPRFISLERGLGALLGSGRIDCYIPVDYPGLNLRLAAKARRAGLPVLYFISPQVWAWGGWRLRKMKRSIDCVAVILPFEVDIYRRAGIPVVSCAHPMLDEVDAPLAPKEAPRPGERFMVLLFPGSRANEFARTLPVLLGAARRLAERYPCSTFTIGLAPLIEESAARVPPELASRMHTTRDGVAELSRASLVLSISGTVTLQSALSGTPTVVLYRMSPMTYALGRLLVRTPWIAMPNILAGRGIVPELIQNDATPERVAAAAAAILDDPARYRRMSSELVGLREALRAPRGIDHVAEAALAMARGADARSLADVVDS